MYWYLRRETANRTPARIGAGICAAVIVAALLAGCADETFGPQDTDGPGPEAIAAQIRPTLAPLWQMMNAPALHNGNFAFIAPDACADIANQIAQARDEFSKTEAGRAALDRIADELQDLVRQARDEDRWGLVLCAIDAHEQLRPGTHLMRLVRNRAMVHAMRPHVVVKGFFDDNERDELYVFLQVTLRREYPDWPERSEQEGEDGGGARPGLGGSITTGDTHVVQVRLNEEFFGLRLVDVAGNKRGVVFEYLADPGHYFTVMMPPRKFGQSRPPAT